MPRMTPTPQPDYAAQARENAAYHSMEANRLAFASFQQQKALTDLLTGLHPNHIGSNVWELVEAQRQKILGLRHQMACMGRGYGRKIKRLEKKIEELNVRPQGQVVGGGSGNSQPLSRQRDNVPTSSPPTTR